MVYTDKLYKLKGAALDELARALYERDVRAFEEIIVELVKLGNMRDYETAADMLATVPIRAKSGTENYVDAAFGALVYDQYFNMFLRACADNDYPESEFVKVLLTAQYAPKNSAFFAWDKSVDRYVTALARTDFELAAEYIEKYDRKYRKYRLLIDVDRDKALNRLLAMALYVKKIDKAAVRDVLMDYDEVSDVLMDIYDKSLSRERVAIVRLLAAFRNDGRVRRFLDEIVARDKSKSVRDAAFSNGRTKKKSAAHFLESLMADGEGFTRAEWTELLSDTEFGAVADKVFFYMQGGDGRIHVLVYDNGEFLDSNDRPVDAGDRKIYVLHPLDVSEDYSSILSFDIDQPFLQIKRPIYGKASDESFYSLRLAGTMIARDIFDKNIKRLGFVFCDKRGDDEPTFVICGRGQYTVGIECDLPESSYTVSAGKVVFFRTKDIVKIKRKQYINTASPLDMATISPRSYSELMYCAYKLFQNA